MMDCDEKAAAYRLISKIDSGEGSVFNEVAITSNQLACEFFRDTSSEIIGVFFSCVYYGRIRIDIAFECDINDGEINKRLCDLIVESVRKRPDISGKPAIWLFNNNRNIIRYLEAKSGSDIDQYEKYNNPARLWSPHTRYASVEYIMRRENFPKRFAESDSHADNVLIKAYEKEKIDEYLAMLDRAMTFEPHDFKSGKEHFTKQFDIYSTADDKAFEAFWDSETDSLIGIYWRKHIEIEDIAVSPEYQRKGYGSFILTRAIKRAFENPDYNFVRLYCVDWNEKGQAFYKKYGMEINGHSYGLRE